MNEIEDRLRGVLNDAVANQEVPAGIVRAAACRAVRVRRRRYAARGVLGAAAVATGGAFLSTAQRDAAPDRLEPAASAPAAGPAPTRAAPAGRIGVRSCDPPAPPGCTRTVVEITREGGVVERFAVADRYAPGATPDPTPPTLVIRFRDGSTQSAVARSDGAGGWVFDVTVPAGADIATVTITGDD